MERTMIELVDLALSGDKEAQTQLYVLTKNKAYYIALQLLKSPQDAEDVLQDAYITAFNKLSTLDNPDKFQGWLDTIVINRAKDVLKKKKPTVFADLKSADGEEYEPSKEEERIEFLPQKNLDYKETKRLVQEIIDELPVEQRIAVMLYYYKEMSVAQIAEYSECSTGTIKSRLNYARKAIKSKVENLEKEGTKLYCTPLLPFLYWLFRAEATEAICASTNIIQGIQQGLHISTQLAEETARTSIDSAVNADHVRTSVESSVKADSVGTSVVSSVKADSVGTSVESSIKAESVRSSIKSSVKAATGNGIKGIVAKVGTMSVGMKVGITAAFVSVAIIGSVAAYQASTPKEKMEGSSMTNNPITVTVIPKENEIVTPTVQNTVTPIITKGIDQASGQENTKQLTDQKDDESQSFDEKIYYQSSCYTNVEHNGFLYYIISDDNLSKDYIYSLDLENGDTKEVISENGWISELKVSEDYIYYYLLPEQGGGSEKRVSIEGGNSNTLIKDFVIDYLDEERYFYSNLEKVFCYDLTTNTETEIVSGYYQFVAKIEDDLYYISPSDHHVTLYAYNLSDNNWTKVIEDKKISGYIAEIQKVNGALYFTSGSYEGTSSQFNGSLYCINEKGKINEVGSDTNDIFNVVGQFICYYGTNDGDYHKYDTITGKTTKYNFSYGENGIRKEEIGSHAYKVSIDKSQKVTVYSYATGTDEEDLIELTSFTCKQEKTYRLEPDIEKAGDTLLIAILGYNKNYELTSYVWYVVNSQGKVIGMFNEK